MEKEKLIIIEGPQGVGKTTLTNWLREKIAYTNLYRLTGNKYTDENAAKSRSKKMYTDLISYIDMLEDCGVNLLFDRIFISELVYCRLGIRTYNYDNIAKKLIKRLDLVDFDIYILNLKLNDTNLYFERTKRDKPSHHNVNFGIESSIQQQNMYTEIMNEIKNLTENITVVDLYTDDFDKAKEQLTKLLNII